MYTGTVYVYIEGISLESDLCTIKMKAHAVCLHVALQLIYNVYSARSLTWFLGRF